VDLHWASSLGLAAFQLLNRDQLTNGNVTENNQGNTAPPAALVMAICPVSWMPTSPIAFDTAPLYNGPFPSSLAWNTMNNVSTTTTTAVNWAGITFGKAGVHKTWELTYRYEYFKPMPGMTRMVDDDFGIFYQKRVSRQRSRLLRRHQHQRSPRH